MEVIELDKNVIYEYMDAKALVKETEEDIRRHRRKTIVQDKVMGSNPEFLTNRRALISLDV